MCVIVHTVDWEIFAVKIFSSTRGATKIKCAKKSYALLTRGLHKGNTVYTCTLHARGRILVLPAASRPSINIRMSFFPKSFAKAFPIFVVLQGEKDDK